jgi:hypothetical protein
MTRPFAASVDFGISPRNSQHPTLHRGEPDISGDLGLKATPQAEERRDYLRWTPIALAVPVDHVSDGIGDGIWPVCLHYVARVR